MLLKKLRIIWFLWYAERAVKRAGREVGLSDKHRARAVSELAKATLATRKADKASRGGVVDA